MSSEVQLTDEAVEAFVDLLTEEEGGPSPATVRTILRSFEVAVRAQWAAEVEKLQRALDLAHSRLDTARDARDLAIEHGQLEAHRLSDEVADEAAKTLIATIRERDSAQAEAKRLRELLAAVLDLVPMREEFHYLDRGIGTKTASGVTLLSARAAVQPGATSHDE